MTFHAKSVATFVSILLSAFAPRCSAQSLKVVPAPIRAGVLPAQVRIFCANNYTSEKCAAHSVMLANELSHYPISQLMQWSFAVVPSDQWKQLVLKMGGNPDSPAFSVLENRTTLFESVLFEPVASRSSELLKHFAAQGTALLDIAVSHELGHALCNDTSERRADENGRALRAQKLVSCQGR